MNESMDLIDKCVERWMNVINGRMDGRWIDGWMDGWVDKMLQRNGWIK